MLRTARLALGALCVLSLLDTAGSAAAAATRDLWVEVRINDVSQPEVALLHIDLREHLFVRLADVRAWHMRPPGSAESGGLVRIDDVPGLRVHLVEDELLLRIDAEPSWFVAQVIRGERSGDGPQQGVPAVFLDYNLFAERSAPAATYSALLQAGTSLGRASFTSSWLGSRVAAVGAAAVDDGQSGWHRLDTDLLLDFPEFTARLTLGDSVTSPGTLGQSVRFTGVHWATDYATRPGVTPYALPVVSGTATVPSSIELYVNQALVQRTSVDAGPFELNNIPIPVGQGAVDIRMRDILGHVQDLSVPYLVMPQLVAAGVTTVDFAAGAVREDYGVENFAYGRSFLSGVIQHGLNEFTTLNVSTELAPDAEELTARGGAVVRATRNVILEFTPAVSHAASAGSGSAVDAGVDSFWHAASLGVHLRAASPGFLELGDLTSGSAPGRPMARLHTEWATQASAQLGYVGSLGVLYASRHFYAAPMTAATTVTYNLSLLRWGSIGAFVSSTRGGSSSDFIAGITFTRYLGKAVTASVTGTADNGASTTELQVGRTAPPDAGWGWELAHARGGVDTDGARIDARSSYGTGSGEIDSLPSGTMGILAWQGGFLWAGGRAWPAQTLTGPAALVEVPDLGGVQVLHDGQPVGRTDSAGRILVPALRPFEDNAITVVPEDLPLTAMVESEKLAVRPYSHGVVRGVVKVSGSESQVFILRLGERELVPAGAEVVLDGRAFPVGTQGLTQLPVGPEGKEGVVSWPVRGSSGPAGRCRVRVPGLRVMPAVAASADPVELDCRSLQ